MWHTQQGRFCGTPKESREEFCKYTGQCLYTFDTACLGCAYYINHRTTDGNSSSKL